MYNRVAMSRSADLQHWSQPVFLTVKDRNLNFCSPGNVIRQGDEYILCVTSYPMPLPFAECPVANDTARVFTMRTRDFKTFSPPQMLLPKGDTPADLLGRMIDPYLLRRDDDYYLFYKQNGASFSRSRDLMHWQYLGHADVGENVCILPFDGQYLMLHSPQNGIAFAKSADLLHWQEWRTTTLNQSEWPWANKRLTAGFAMETENGEKHRYAVFFHGSSDCCPETHGHASVALVFTDNFVDFYE